MNTSEQKAKSPLRLKRRALGMRQHELANRLHVTPAAVSFWEVHGIYTRRTARKVATALGCDWKDLLEERPHKKTVATMSNLAKARLKAGLLVRELAEMLKASPSTVCQQEKRGIQNARIARRYAAALGCDWKDLLD